MHTTPPPFVRQAERAAKWPRLPLPLPIQKPRALEAHGGVYDPENRDGCWKSSSEEGWMVRSGATGACSYCGDRHFIV